MTHGADKTPDPALALAEELAKLVRESDADDADVALDLVRRGADPNAHLSELNSTPLIEAVTYNRLRITEALLNHGGQIGHRLERPPWQRPSGFSLLRAQPLSPSIWVVALTMGFFNLIDRRLPIEDMDLGDITIEEECNSKAMARLLAQHGADPTRFDSEFRPAAFGADLTLAHDVTPDLFHRHAAPRFGTANPEPCDNPFYLEQIRTGRSGYGAGRAVLGDKHSSLDTGPVWSFDRFGQTATRLDDGRLVVIAGEHEDHYDPDFNIYSDVTVFDGAGGVAHYLYPRDLFPPTDFHTATLLDDHILLIGNLGYPQDRREGETQVLRLNLSDFSIERVETTGDKPGWVYRHSARLEGGHILVTGGKTEPGHRDRDAVHRLDLATMTWQAVS